MVGSERDKLCDPLFDSRVPKNVPGLEATLFGRTEKEKEHNPVLSVSKVVWRVYSRVETNQWQYTLGSLGVAGGLLATGDMTSHVKGLSICGTETIVLS